MTTSEELHEQWLEHGGDMKDIAEKMHNDIIDDKSHIKWRPSLVKRWRRTPLTSYDKRQGKSRIGEKLEDPVSEREHVREVRWKHTSTETWLTIRSSTSRIVGAPVGFEAFVTIKGQSLTVGENIVSTDKEEVFEWAIEWMKNHHDVSELYD